MSWRTCSASPGAAASRSTSRPSSGRGAGGWCWSARPPAPSWCPLGRLSCCGWPRRGATWIPATWSASRPACTAGPPGPIPAGAARRCAGRPAAGRGWTSVPSLPLLRQPTLIVSGDDDPIIPLANAHLMHRLIPHSRLHVFHGGHLGLVTEAPQLAPTVDCFLGELHDDGSGR